MILLRRWEKCCEDAVDCCETLQKQYEVENFGSCEGFWDEDERTCYHSTSPGEVIHRPCPYLHSIADISSCQCKNLKFDFCFS